MGRRAGITRTSLIDEAVRLIDQEGFDRLALSTLARRLGVRPPSLFEHVEGTADLVRAVRLRSLEQQVDLVRRAATGRSRDEAVRAVLRAYRQFARGHPGLYLATQRNVEDETPELRSAARELLGAILEVLRGYGIEGPEAVHAARFLRSVVHGFLSLEISAGFAMKVDLDESYDRTIDRVVDGLAHWRVPPRPRSGRGR